MPSCIIPYPYYYPDDAVSARHITDFSEGLCFHGWDVQVLTGNRYHAKIGKITPYCENRNGVKIIRSWYPYFPNSKNSGRLLNSFCFSIISLIKLLFATADIIVFGTNPPFIYYVIPFLLFFKPRVRIALWGFDLYPEAIIVDGIKLPKMLKRALLWWAGISYRGCALLVDIGSCMHKRFMQYHPRTKYETIVPWALNEPVSLAEPDIKTRFDLFNNVRLGILYSGTIGKAHQFEEFILLARELRRRNASVAFCFAGRGNCYQKLRDMISQEDTNIHFAGFVDEELLPLRLASADIHMISLRQGWEGIVVPSKFFGSLAAGRPLLYCGTQKSFLAELIKKEDLGFVVEMNSIRVVADILEELSCNKDKIDQMKKQAFQFYNTYFSKKSQLEKWDSSLKSLLK
jgi:glycosyltransferase involved in cell wall biosynthesis